jgi:hypothetical protein
MIEPAAEFRFALFDYRDRRDRNAIREWTEGLDKRQRGQLNAKLDMLQKYGNGPLLQMSAHILKLKGNGNVQIRPMLCRGPIDEDTEFTLLFGATEVGWKLVPVDAVARAETRRSEVVTDPEKRRVAHERIN